MNILYCFICIILLQGGYPAKLKKVLIVTAPLWFKAPFKILRLFVREKLRERVYTVSVSQLQAHIPRESLPAPLGGSLVLDHDGWLEQCLTSMSATRETSPLPLYGNQFFFFNILQIKRSVNIQPQNLKTNFICINS